MFSSAALLLGQMVVEATMATAAGLSEFTLLAAGGLQR